MHTSPTPSTSDEPLVLVLEFARKEQAGDPYAFRVERQDYLLRSAGGGFQTAELAWDAALLNDLKAVRLPKRDPAVVQRLGESLRRFLDVAGFALLEDRILTAVAAARPVQLTVRSAAAELYSLPWELCTIKSTGQHLGELPGVLVRYEWPETQTIPPQPSAHQGRILFCWSAAAGAVPAAEHQAGIASACERAAYPFDVSRDVLAHVSLRRLGEALESARRAGQPIRVLHLLCHGTTAGSTFGLALDRDDADEADGPVVVDAGRLRQVLAPHAGLLRLVVLAACDGANTGALGNQLGSVAQALHRAGLAQVVASRYPLSVAGSIRLTEVFYPELLGAPQQPGSIEAALLTARQRLAWDAAQLDWAALQYFARAADDHVHVRPQAPAPTPAPAAPAAPAAPLVKKSPAPVVAGLALLLVAAVGGLVVRPMLHHKADQPGVVLPDRVHWSVRTEPSGAAVVLLPTQEQLGVTPWTQERLRSQGSVTIELRREGYEPQQLKLDPARDCTHEVNLKTALIIN